MPDYILYIDEMLSALHRLTQITFWMCIGSYVFNALVFGALVISAIRRRRRLG